MANQKDLNVSLLADIYGSLLTKKQLEILREYYDYDSSLAEIAEKYQIARQSVKDSLNAATETLYRFEEKLKLRSRMERISEITDILAGAADEKERKLLSEIKAQITY